MLKKAKELNIHRRSYMKTKEELQKVTKDTMARSKEIIFSVDSPISLTCLNEPRKQQIIHKKVYDEKLMDDTVRKRD